MSIGEFDSPSKPASEAYREGWDRAFEPTVSYETYKSVAQQAMEEITGYKNGCPILPHE